MTEGESGQLYIKNIHMQIKAEGTHKYILLQ